MEDQLGQDIKDGIDAAKEGINKLVLGLGSIIENQVGLKSSIDTRLQGFDGNH